MRVLLRADGGAALGAGHIMRCLALADELRGRGCYCVFAMRSIGGHLHAEVLARGYAVIPLEFDDEPHAASVMPWLARLREPRHQIADAEETLRACAAISCGLVWDWVAVDHYGLSAVWQDRMRVEAGHILTIDDLADRTHNCDLLLDQNPQISGRYRRHLSRECRLLIGPEYALLRHDFQKTRNELQRQSLPVRPLRVLVSFGAADEQGVALDVITALEECGFGSGQVKVVAGKQNPHLAKLESQCLRLGYQCESFTDHMAELLAASDLGLGAGGVSMIERFCMGLPSIVIPIAENQRPGARHAKALGAIELVDPEPQERVAAIATALRDLMLQPDRLQTMSRAACALCDGRGAGRVAETMQCMGLVARRATPVDMRNLFDWRNAPQTRLHSGAGEVITLENHRRWFDDVLSDSARHMWIAMMGKTPMGVVRFDTHTEDDELHAVVSVYLVPGTKGRGWGRAVIACGIAQAQRAWPALARIDASISLDNQASLRAFAACGFELGDKANLYHLILRGSSL